MNIVLQYKYNKKKKYIYLTRFQQYMYILYNFLDLTYNFKGKYYKNNIIFILQ